MAISRNAVIGIDAGGTSVRVVLADSETGTVRAELKGAADPDGGPSIVHSLISHLLDRSFATPENISSACAGITKITRTGVRKAWETELRSLLPFAGISIVPDYVIAFHGAIPDAVGVVVIAGTGSVVYGANGAGRDVRVGGRGWEYGDEGSGTWLTTEAVRRTLRALDGLEKTTALTQEICAVLKTDEPASLGEAARQRAASEGRGFLAPLVLQQAIAGDSEASNLFVGAGGWLAAQARAAAETLGFTAEDSFIVATVGGLWESGDHLLVPFRSVMNRWFPNALIAPPEAAPVSGAVRIACRAAQS